MMLLPGHQKGDNMSIHFDTVPGFDRQTYTRTDRTGKHILRSACKFAHEKNTENGKKERCMFCSCKTESHIVELLTVSHSI